jgi:GT2 family glycosyltransferase/glycosyltransferase involved in cell wall biosynthesis/uncharacterized coiled-coil protein SlyX
MFKIRPRILFVVDHPNWAHDFKTQNLARVLANDYDIQKRYQAEVTATDLDGADLILVYYWLQFEAMKPLTASFKQYSEKLLVGVCSNWELESERREPGLAVLSKFARAVFVNNLFLFRDCEPILDVPVFYTPNGVDINFFHPAPQKALSATLRVGWAGSLTNHGNGYKGYHEVIVPAVKALDRVELITAEGDQERRCPDEMRLFYQSLDAYICASQTEGTPNPCLEAAACGIPLLTTRVGNMPELVRHGSNGFFIERQPEDLTEKLRCLRDSPALRSSLSKNLLEDIQPWDWSIQAQGYRRMFEEMLKLNRKASMVRLRTTDVSGSSVALDEQLISEPGLTEVSPVLAAMMQTARASLALLPESFLERHRNVEITVVMLSYGRVERTLSAIHALKDNVLVPFKLLLIDNNSSEEVRTKLAETCSRYDFIELILLDENLGCVGGRDLAFKRVTTSYVMLIDNDIEVLPGGVEHLLHLFDLHPEAAAITGKVVLPDGRIQLCGGNFWVDQEVQFMDFLGQGRRFDENIGVTEKCDWVPGCLTLIRTDMLRRFPYDLEMRNYFEDNEWCHRINQAGAGKFYRVVEALGIHYHESKVPDTSQPLEESRKQTMKYIETLAYFYRKHDLIYLSLFHFVPELGPPTNPLSVSAARILLELVNTHGGDWVLDRWNRNQLSSLFAVASLSAEKEQAISVLSAQLAEKEQFIADSQQVLRALSAQLIERDTKFGRNTGTLGWRLIGLYGKVKYRYLLPVYRLLHLMPRNPNERS